MSHPLSCNPNICIYIYVLKILFISFYFRYFVLIGATSAMGPLDMLLKYGANIIALDIDIERFVSVSSYAEKYFILSFQMNHELNQ